MIRSMTGYGACEDKNDFAQVYVEIKSLNSRFFDFYPKTCKALSIYDDEVKNKIKNLCLRGNFQFKTKIDFFCDTKSSLNKIKFEEYVRMAKELQEKSTEKLTPLSIDKLMTMPNIYESTNIDMEEIKGLYFECVESAILELNKTRSIEGENIEKSFLKNLSNLDKGLKTISKLHNMNIDKEFVSYKNKIVEILNNSEIEEDRLYQEIAIMIDKKDISEELVRLDSHLSVLRNYLLEDGSIGKKINFILQEIGREINTITSKSNNIKITYKVLSMKNEVEQIREQAQNIL